MCSIEELLRLRAQAILSNLWGTVGQLDAALKNRGEDIPKITASGLWEKIFDEETAKRVKNDNARH